MKIETTTNKLREILKTVNPRLIKEIEIKECSDYIPFKLGWYQITIGSNIYVIDVFDMDSRYTEDAISYFEEMIKEFKHLVKRIRD